MKYIRQNASPIGLFDKKFLVIPTVCQSNNDLGRLLSEMVGFVFNSN